MKLTTTLLALTASLAPLLHGQSNPTQPRSSISSVSYHVTDENRSKYEAWLKGRFRQYAQAYMKEDPSVTAVIAARVIFGGVREPEANAYVSYVSTELPKGPSATPVRDKVAKQLFNKTYEEFMSEASPLRKRLGQTLSVIQANTPPNLADGDLLRIDFKRVTPGRMQDYIQLEREYAPLRKAQVEAGSMKAWTMATLLLPGGSERDYDAYTVHVGKSLEQILTWGRDTGAIAAKMNPPFNLAGTAMRGMELQKNFRSETRMVVMVARP